jgi:hypothetical protein
MKELIEKDSLFFVRLLGVVSIESFIFFSKFVMLMQE